MTHDLNTLLAELNTLRLPELKERYRAAVGTETRCPNRTFLIRSICSALRPTTGSAPPTEATVPAPEPTAEEHAAPREEPVALADEDVEALDDEDNPVEAADDAQAKAATPELIPSLPEPIQPSEQPAEPPRAADTALQRVPRQPRGRFGSMTIEELRHTYREVVGRDTGSDHKRYLIWKIREAEKGRVPVGPRAPRARASEPADVRILPLRLEADAVAAMDAAWRARGMKTRMDFLRRALGHYLESLGASDAAAKFAGDASA